MLDADGKGLCLSIVSPARKTCIMVRSIGGSFCQLCRRFGSNSLDDDFVGLLGSSVITIVIQIDVDVIGIFANDATGEFAVGELQCIT